LLAAFCHPDQATIRSCQDKSADGISLAQSYHGYLKIKAFLPKAASGSKDPQSGGVAHQLKLCQRDVATGDTVRRAGFPAG
jgi:hypothetical protein